MSKNKQSKNEVILSVNDLSVSFRQGNDISHIVKKISFTIEHNTTVAIVGESGSGKSLTAYSIMRLLPYPTAFHPSGEIWFRGEGCAISHFDNNTAETPQATDIATQSVELLSRSLKSMGAIRGCDIGMVFQEPMSALNPLQTIEQQIGESVSKARKLSKTAIRSAVLSLLDNVHIRNPEDKLKAYPHQLSGGQRQRVMIAMVLANKPKLLIADEPTTALDVTVQKEILDLLKELQTKYKMSILLITHDLGVVKYMADKVLIMQQGEIVERGATQQVLNQPNHEYTRLLMTSFPKGAAASICNPMDTCPVVASTENLHVRFFRNKPLFGKSTDFFHALKGVNLQLFEGTTLGVLGESGSGKSTLAMAMLKLIESEGTITLDKQVISKLNDRNLRPMRKMMQVVFQDPFSSLSPRLSVKQIISEGLHLQSELSTNEIDLKVDKMMHEVGLDPSTKHRYPHEFSGGQRQRIAIARAFILNPKLVFLDEPTSALDHAVQMQVVNLLKILQEKRRLSYVFISHDIHVIKSISHFIVVIKNGQIVEYGPTQEIMKNPQNPYTQKLLSATL